MNYCQGPAPKTKFPNFVVPPKACDAHCHVFGPAKRFPFSPGRSYTPPDASFETMQGLQKVLGIERAVIVQATCHGTDNTAALDAIARSNGRYRLPVSNSSISPLRHGKYSRRTSCRPCRLRP